MTVLRPLIRDLLRSPLRSPFERRGGWSPAQLFQAGEQGAWYDPSDFSTQFQDSAGTTPVTATGQPVGKINDKSGRGNHATQATAAARPVLQIDGNGRYYWDFDGVDDFISTGTLVTSTARTTFIAAKSNAGAASSNRVCGYTSNESLYDDTAGWSYFSPTTSIGGASRASVLVFGAVKPSDASATLYLGKTAGTTFDPADIVATGFALAAEATSGANKLACRIYGAVALNRAATGAEVIALATYLGAKAGVVV